MTIILPRSSLTETNYLTIGHVCEALKSLQEKIWKLLIVLKTILKSFFPFFAFLTENPWKRFCKQKNERNGCAQVWLKGPKNQN
jgi:valyl-tRNA synthetase